MRCLLLLIAPLLLTACGGNDNAADSASNEAAAAAAIAGSAAGLVDTTNLPDFVEVYEGATPVLNMTSNEGKTRAGVFAYTVAAPAADVISFNRAAFGRAGIEISTELSAPGGLSLGGQNKETGRTLFITITPGESGKPTSVNISHSRTAD